MGVSLHREWHESQLYVADLLEGACYATVQSLTPLPCSQEDYASMHDAHYVSARYAAAEAKVRCMRAWVRAACVCPPARMVQLSAPIQCQLVVIDFTRSSPPFRCS